MPLTRAKRIAWKEKKLKNEVKERDVERQSVGGEAKDSRLPVTVVGLGAMGSALAEAFLDQGYPTTVWNRSAGKADPLVARGAIRAATVADATAASGLVVVCVLDYAVFHEVFDHVDDLSGRVLVNLTNGTPEQARQTAAWAEERGASYLDGGIMAVPPMIGGPEAVLLYSGTRNAFESHQKELGSLGTGTYLGADPGLASLYDLALLGGMYGMFAGFLHATALVGTEGARATEFVSLLAPWLHGMIEALPGLAEQIDAGNYTKDVESNLKMQAVAYANIVEASRAQGIDVALIEPMQKLIERRIADGHGTDDISGLIELIVKR
jgi:3-hydroxyisobutyrate dehydrogenase-like beta-hydroxyacid dehydrogenase